MSIVGFNKIEIWDGNKVKWRLVVKVIATFKEKEADVDQLLYIILLKTSELKPRNN